MATVPGMIPNAYKYVVSKGRDELGNEFYYAHKKAFPYCPVFGSIGSYKKAKKVANEYNAGRGRR